MRMSHVEGAGNPGADDYLGPHLCVIHVVLEAELDVSIGTRWYLQLGCFRIDPFEVAGGTPMDSFAQIPEAVLWAFVHREWPLLESWQSVILSVC